MGGDSGFFLGGGVVLGRRLVSLFQGLCRSEDFLDRSDDNKVSQRRAL